MPVDDTDIKPAVSPSDVRAASAPQVPHDVRLDNAKRRQILEGANRVFLGHGFDAASMGAIAQQAGVSKGTLYVYFKNKEELFGAIVEDKRREHAKQLFAFDYNEDIELSLTRLGRSFIEFLCRDEGMSSVRTVIAISTRMPALGEQFYMSGPKMGLARLSAYLEEKVRQGVLEPHDCEVAAAQLIEGYTALIFKPLLFNAMSHPEPALVERVVTFAVQTYLRAWRVPAMR